jgi:hypothetical protein
MGHSCCRELRIDAHLIFVCEQLKDTFSMTLFVNATGEGRG